MVVKHEPLSQSIHCTPPDRPPLARNTALERKLGRHKRSPSRANSQTTWLDSCDEYAAELQVPGQAFTVKFLRPSYCTSFSSIDPYECKQIPFWAFIKSVNLFLAAHYVPDEMRFRLRGPSCDHKELKALLQQRHLCPRRYKTKVTQSEDVRLLVGQ